MSNRQFFVDLDLNLNQLLNTRVENLSSVPSATNAMTGRIIYNTIAKKLQYCTGTAWVDIPPTLTITKAETSTGTEYVLTYAGTALTEKIVVPKDKVVESGSIVTGTWAGNTFTPSASGADSALKLVIANSQDVVYINVGQFDIDSSTLTVTTTTAVPSNTEVAAGSYSLNEVVQLILNNIAYLLDAQPESLKATGLTGLTGTIPANFNRSAHVLMQAYVEDSKSSTRELVEISLTITTDNSKITWSSNLDLTSKSIIVVAHAIKGKTLNS